MKKMQNLQIQSLPGGLESLDESDRERVRNMRDPQLDRAMDLLKGILLFTERVSAERSACAESDSKMAAAK